MKIKAPYLIAAICFGSLVAFSSNIVFADAQKSQPGQMIKVLEDLKSKGYVIVKKVELKDNGVFDATVVNAVGKDLTVQINAQTGEMTKDKDDVEGWTALEIAKKAQAAGYDNLYEITTELMGDEYIVKALDAQGNKMKLKLDIKTGNITKADI
jgi:hypothetical protein